MNSPERVDVLGLRFDRISMAETEERILDAVRGGSPLHIVTANVDFVIKARRDPSFARLVDDAGLCVADGVPVLWAAALLGAPLAGRVNGTDLVRSCARIAATEGARMALVGAAPGVAERAARVLMAAAPGAEVLAVPTPTPLSEDQAAGVARAVREAGASILLAALGAPLQERFLARRLEESGAAVGIGVGGALDMISGDVRRAPVWMQRGGLEWLHRMLRDPRRLCRRYLLDDAPFVPLVLGAWLAGLPARIRSRRRG